MKLLPFVCALFVTLNMFCQSYHIGKIDIENGLSNNYVLGITQDKDGYLWFATESGLNRFDGNEFKVYKKQNDNYLNSISGNELNVVYADKYDSLIWIATQRDGLNSFDYQTNKFKHYKNVEGDSISLPTNDVTNIINSNDSNLLITSYHKGFAYFNKKTGAFISKNTETLPSLPSNRIWSIAEDLDGDIYLGHDSVGLSIYNPKTNKVTNLRHDPNDMRSLPGNKVNVIFIDDASNIWLGTNDGLAMYDKQNHTFNVFKHKEGNSNSLLSDFVCTICQTSDNKLWIGTENGGVSILDLKKQLFTHPGDLKFVNIKPGDTSYSLSNKTVRCVFNDSFHNVWIGTYGGGINFISHKKSFFNRWAYSPIAKVKNALSTKTAWGICSDAKGRLWVGTDGAGIDVFADNEKIKNINTSNSLLTDNAVISAFQDSKNNLWFGTFRGGVNILKNGSDKIKPFSVKITYDVRCFAEDEKGVIWIGTSDGIYKYNPVSKSTVKYTRNNSELSDNLVRSIRCVNGYIWVGFFGEGLSYYDKDMHLIKHFNNTSGLISNRINCIYSDSVGNMWCGSANGLFFFDKNDYGKFEVFYDDKKKDDLHICAITEDKKGNIWLSTTSGIASFDSKSKTFNTYKHLNYPMIPPGSFMSGSVVDANNQIYFGSQNGVCFFNPDDLPSNLSLPKVRMTNFIVFNKNIKQSDHEILMPLDKKLQLSYDQNSFKISFNVLDYALTDIVDYSYRLKGLEDRWYHVDNTRSATFRNIPHGEYCFQIKSHILNQVEPQNIINWNVEITPPFWLTWWAKVFYFIFTLLILYLLLIFSKKRMQLKNSFIMERREHEKDKELNDERLSFFTNIAHELRTPITLILGPIEDLISSKTMNAQETSKLKIIEKSTRHLLNLINQIMEFRKTETENRHLNVKKGDLDKVIKDVTVKYYELNTNNNIKINIDFADGDYLMYFDKEVITIILDNLISNALKYTNNGSITIGLQRVSIVNNDIVEIKVEDTGKGISKEDLPKIFTKYYRNKSDSNISGTGIGMALVKNLVKLHEGDIEVESELGKGSVFKIVLYPNNLYKNAIHIEKDKDDYVDTDIIVEDDSSSEKSGEKQIILIVEDNREINNYIQDSLSDDFNVLSAFDGKEGIEKAFKYIPDLIISDIMMPELDGFELTNKIKKDVRTSHIPIVLLTAKDTILDKTKAYQLGIDSYLTKPFSAVLLQTRILNILENRNKIAAQFINSHSKDKESIVNESLTKIDNEFMDKVKLLVEENLDSSELDVKFIAHQMAMSHSSLYRKIKALTNLTANEYIRNIRIKKAEEYLLSGRYSISEIAYMVGMSSSNYFRKCFKDVYGKTPSDYLKDLSNR